MNEGTAPIVFYNGKPGYLHAWDAGLGFAWSSRDDDEQHWELGAEELSLYPPVENLNDIPRETPVVAKYGHNTVLDAPFEFLYEFGYYTKDGCVVYNHGECSMQDAHAFKLDQIRVATPEDMKEQYWGN
jgi:hypothetical protein